VTPDDMAEEWIGTDGGREEEGGGKTAERERILCGAGQSFRFFWGWEGV
jgi:hypothetical protein